MNNINYLHKLSLADKVYYVNFFLDMAKSRVWQRPPVGNGLRRHEAAPVRNSPAAPR